MAEQYHVEYIRYATTVVEGKGARAEHRFWRGYEGARRDNNCYGPENIQDERIIIDFWQHLDERTLPGDGAFKHGWRAYSNQAYRDAKLLEDIDRRRVEIAEEAAEPGLTAERASALRLRRDELEPEPLAETLRGRVDFSLVGDYEDEVGSWRFKPPRGKEARAPPPHPMDSRRPSPDALDHDYRVIVLQEELEEPSEAELLATAFESDARVLFAEDGWPASMKRIAFKDGEAAQKTLLSTLGVPFVRKLTRWWRRPENHDVCMICQEDAYMVWEDLVCTSCMHIYCKVCIVGYWRVRTAFDAQCPACRREPEWCPFPASALIDPWRAGNWPPALPLDAGAETEEEREEGELAAGKPKKTRRGGAKARRERKRRAAAAARESS